MPRDVPDPPSQGSQWMQGWDKWGSVPSFFGGDRSTFASATPNFGLLDKLFSVLRSRLLDRRLTVQTQHGELMLTVTELDVPVDSGALSTGQLQDITVTAEDVCWRDVRLQQVAGTLRNASLRTAKSPELVAAPVELRVTLSEEQLDTLLARFRPELQIEVTPEAVVLIRWRQHPQWGHFEVHGGVDGTRIWVKAHALVRGGRRVSLSRRVPPVSFRVPVPADRVTITAVSPQSRSIDLLARVDQVRAPVPSGGLEELVKRLGKLGTLLDVSRWTY